MLLLTHCRRKNIIFRPSIFQKFWQPCYNRSNCYATGTTTDSSSVGTGTPSPPPLDKLRRPNLVAFKSISKDELGFSILNQDANSALRKAVIFAKTCSLGSSAMGLCMIPIISSTFVETVADRPGVAAFLALTDSFLVFFALTPFLLHFLTKRFVVDLYYNPRTQMFTTVHYNFLLRKRALRFTADEVEDAAHESASNRFSLQLATCSVRSYPLLLLLEPEFYTDKDVFAQMTKNIKRHERNRDSTGSSSGSDSKL